MKDLSLLTEDLGWRFFTDYWGAYLAVIIVALFLAGLLRNDPTVNYKIIKTGMIFAFILSFTVTSLSTVALSFVDRDLDAKVAVSNNAEYNISQIYDFNTSDKLDFEHDFKIIDERKFLDYIGLAGNENTEKLELTESTLQYDDVENKQRYDLVFKYDESNTPYILKTGIVTDEVIESFEK